MKSVITNKLSIGYGNTLIVDDLNLEIPQGKITTIIGANGCGKSTILKTIARILQPKCGKILINNKELYAQSSKEIAREMAFLPQSPAAPSGLTVEELVAYGRFPHQGGFGRLQTRDWEIINWALDVTGLKECKSRSIEALSGGQRQRVWIAMALAQETGILLLDEPTTYLDLAHQLEILKLLKKLNREQGRTIVMVIHELNIAARFADYMIGVKNGKIVCHGSSGEVMTPKNMREIFNIDAEIIVDSRNNRPVCVTYDLME